MKKIQLLVCIALAAIYTMPVNGQTVQNKNFKQKMKDGISSLEYSYKYYLDENGNEVLHGPFKAKGMSMDSSLYGETQVVTVECNYTNGIMNGRVKYSYHKKMFVGERVLANGVVCTRIIRKPTGDINDNVEFDVYNNTMTGKIDIDTKGSIYGFFIKCKGSVKDGVVADGTEFYYKEGRDEYVRTNLIPLGGNRKYNLASVGNYSDHFYLSVPYLDDALTPRVYFPKYTVYTLDDVLAEYNALQYEGVNDVQFDNYLRHIKKEYPYFSEEEKARIKEYEDGIKQRTTAREQAIKDAKINAQKQLDSIYNVCLAEFNKLSWINKVKFQKTNHQRYTDGTFTPIIYDENIEQLIFDKSEKVLLSLQHSLTAPQEVRVDQSLRDIDAINKIREVGLEEMQSLYDTYKELEPLAEMIKIAQDLQSQAKTIELYYTNTTCNLTVPSYIKRENCTKKMGKQKILYEAYCLIGQKYNEESENVAPEKIYVNLQEFAKISSFLVEKRGEDTKNIEKELKKATTADDKIAILKKYL